MGIREEDETSAWGRKRKRRSQRKGMTENFRFFQGPRCKNAATLRAGVRHFITLPPSVSRNSFFSSPSLQEEEAAEDGERSVAERGVFGDAGFARWGELLRLGSAHFPTPQPPPRRGLLLLG